MKQLCPLPALTACLLLASLLTGPVLAQRQEIPLQGPWTFHREGERETKQVELPATFEEHESVEFDGVGVYTKEMVPFDLPEGKRAILHFQAVATQAEVTFNGQLVGEHLGGWTPFRVDITAQVRAAAPGASHLLTVRVDEKVGHNSQGFMPVFAPHFGGIWQQVRLLIVSDCQIDDLGLAAEADVDTGAVRLQVPLQLPSSPPPLNIVTRYRLKGQSNWLRRFVTPVPATVSEKSNNGTTQRLHTTVPCTLLVPDRRYWSPADPRVYEFEVQLQEGAADPIVVDRAICRAGFRSLQVQGEQFILNGQPVMLRGVLNWGYAPPRVAPSLDEQQMRRELELARSYGFNMMKFCLWVPPQRYLELADELGMFTWMEYPTWHSKWTADQLPTLEREFTEFFCYDRNHPSVALRSLTCETGPSADLNVIRTLYDRCHEMIPGSIVEDDSSWISWNRVHDFYDDHPYGNNHTWVTTLDRLKQHIAERTTKPLVLGEAIAADTWSDPSQLIDRVGDERPFWLPRFLEGNRQWLMRMAQHNGPGGLTQLVTESKQYALLMRKYQVETYRREVPSGGYVVSVIRDIPLCSMGLVDYLGKPKWSPDDWSWHGATMLLLSTPQDRRSFGSGEPLPATISISHFGESSLEDGKLEVTLRADNARLLRKVATKTVSSVAPGLHRLEPLSITLPAVAAPTRMTLSAKLQSRKGTVTNQWPLWLVPQPVDVSGSVQWHDSATDTLRALLPSAKDAVTAPSTETAMDRVVVATRFDQALLDMLAAGGRVLLVPDGEKGSFPLRDEWFLRGAPYLPHHPLLQQVPRQLLLELQHFDLAGPVIPDVRYLEQIDPILMLWNNHDLDQVKTAGLIFETRVGQGRLLVSAVHHAGTGNAVGHWLLAALVEHLLTGPQPRHELTAETLAFMRQKVDEQQIDLTGKPWQLRVDAENQGLQQGWHTADYQPDEQWKPIQIGRAWEGQGYPTLDGWAWYRRTERIPASWQGHQVYVSFEGVDDYYELYVNGQRAGSGGDIESRTTAFELRQSHNVTALVEPGKEAAIAIRVYDWYGAGGVFRPVTLSTASLNHGIEVLQ